MPTYVQLAASVACLAAVSSALPANIDANVLSSRQVSTDCGHGVWFYRCANGYVGCFSSDPCSLPPINGGNNGNNNNGYYTASTSTTTTTTTVVAVPTTTTQPPAAASTTKLTCPAGATGVKVYEPTMYNLNTGDPDLVQPPVNFIQLQKRGTHPPLEQVAVWRGIPAGAKTCNFRWSQAVKEQRVFDTEDNGSVRATQLTGLPADGKFSVNSVKPFTEKSTTIRNPNFTLWDEVPEKRAHTMDPLNCAETIAVKLEIDNQGDGHLFMQQDFQNGLYIEYIC